MTHETWCGVPGCVACHMYPSGVLCAQGPRRTFPCVTCSEPVNADKPQDAECLDCHEARLDAEDAAADRWDVGDF